MPWTHDQTTSLPAAQCQALNAVLARLSGGVGSRYQLGDGEIAVNRSGYVHHGAALAAAPLEGLLDPAMVTTVHNGERWTDMLTCLWRMDTPEKGVLAALAGTIRQTTVAADEAPRALNVRPRTLIDLPADAPFFRVTEPDGGSVRPVGHESSGGGTDCDGN